MILPSYGVLEWAPPATTAASMRSRRLPEMPFTPKTVMGILKFCHATVLMLSCHRNGWGVECAEGSAPEYAPSQSSSGTPCFPAPSPTRRTLGHPPIDLRIIRESAFYPSHARQHDARDHRD